MKGYDYIKDGIPKAGSKVKVKWDENSEYSCIFLGSNESYSYNVSNWLENFICLKKLNKTF